MRITKHSMTYVYSQVVPQLSMHASGELTLFKLFDAFRGQFRSHPSMTSICVILITKKIERKKKKEKLNTI